MKRTDEERNNLIYNFYFNDKLTLTQISKKVNLSISQVSRILSKFPIYMQEKAKRKEENRVKHSEQAKEIMRRKRCQKYAEEKAIINTLHNQDAAELSYFYPLSKSAIIKYCPNAYEYNVKRKRFELKTDIVYSNDMPSKIKY